MPPDARRLGPHPEPPADLAERDLPLRITGQHCYRCYPLEHPPLFFDRSDRSRFNAPAGEFGMLCVGADMDTYGRTSGERILTRSALRRRGFAVVRADRPLRLVDLTGEGLFRVGADEGLSAGRAYRLAQRWALAFWQHPARPDGLYYRSRHDPSRFSAAIFDRASDAIAASPLWSLADPADDVRHVLAELLSRYDFGLVEDTP